MTGETRNPLRKSLTLISIFALGTSGIIYVILNLDDFTTSGRKPRAVTQLETEELWTQDPELSSLGPGRPPSPETFAPQRAAKPYPPITEVKPVAAMDAGTAVDDDELVLGVAIGDQARAYPIDMMTGPSREIFNDTLAGRPIAATW